MSTMVNNGFRKENANVNVSLGELALSEEAIKASMRQAELEQSVESKRILSTITVPTNDATVKNMLRQYNHPITLYAESAAERRERLKTVLAELISSGETVETEINETLKKTKVSEESGESSTAHKKVFYTEGVPLLKKVRTDILRHSISAAKTRIRAPKKIYLSDKLAKEKLFNNLKSFTSQQSEIGDNRALSSISISPCGKKVAIGSWSGNIKIWSLSQSTKVEKNNDGNDDYYESLKLHSKDNFKEVSNNGVKKENKEIPHNNLVKTKEERVLCHSARVTDAKFYPFAKLGKGLELVSSGCDGIIKLWNSKSPKPIAALKGHTQRLGKMAFLPLDKQLLMTTSFDKTWCLWDLKAEKNVLRQTGHSAELYAAAVHPDSSLCLTGDLSGIARIWDLRTGQAVLNLRGHVRQILAADFSSNGVNIATGSGDNTVKIWDLRNKNLFYTIPAHFKDVSSVKFQNKDNNFLLTSSFDKTIRVWSSKTFKLISTMIGHEDKVSDCDIHPLDDSIYSTSYDRTWKRWDYK